MTLELVPLGTLRFRMTETLRLSPTPAATRVLVQFENVRWEGERLRATQKGALAGDWLTVGPEGTATLEIRFTLETDDGALVFVQGHGRTDAAQFAREGGPMYFAPRFETGDARYAWLNRVQAVAKGQARGLDVEFEVYELR